jgi:hypothetical protein
MQLSKTSVSGFSRHIFGATAQDATRISTSEILSRLSSTMNGLSSYSDCQYKVESVMCLVISNAITTRVSYDRTYTCLACLAYVGECNGVQVCFKLSELLVTLDL